MSLHHSLKRIEKITTTRSVLSRIEKIKWLKEKGMWQENNSVIGLPKIKIVKLKVAKEGKIKQETTEEKPKVQKVEEKK